MVFMGAMVVVMMEVVEVEAEDAGMILNIRRR